jgi:hypothetical protein
VKMEIELDDETLSPDEISELEERRLDELNNSGIDEQGVLENATKHLNIWTSYFQENITRGKDDLNFCLRDQWTAVERSEFTRLFKPAMTFNKLYDSTKKVCGEQRKNKPDLIVRSLTGKATQAQIDLRADLVRTISYQSQNDLVYQTAFKSALMQGYGAFQVGLEYENARSFNKKIVYTPIVDPTVCSWDATALKPHKGDGNYCSRRYVLTRDEFFATYPYVLNPVSFNDPYMLLDFQWQTRDTITICDEWVKEWFPLLIYKLSNGETVTADEWKEREKTFEDNKEYVKDAIVGNIIARDIPKIVAERQTQDYRIMHYRMIRNMILDFSLWPSRQLAIPFVDGDSYYIEGRQYTKSFIHEARDAQKCVNFFNSEIAAEVKNRRREQWLGTPDNIIGYEQDWRNPELQMGILRAKPDPKTGQMPTKQEPWDLSPALMNNAQRATQDIKEILGFSESEELQGRDISGKARRERKMEGSMSSYVFMDNLNQAIEQGGRIVLDLLPHVIGEDERSMVVSKKDGRSETVTLNKHSKDIEGLIENKIDKGEYDIEIDAGPSFAVQKEIALEFLQQTLQAFPQAFPLVADLWAKNLDVQFMPQMAERFQSMVPPAILAKEQGKPAPPPQPNPQEQQAQMEMEAKKAEIQNKAQEIAIKQQNLELDKQKLMLEAKKMQAENQLNIYDHQADLQEIRLRHSHDTKKHEGDFSLELAKLLTDLHKHHNPQIKPQTKQND